MPSVEFAKNIASIFSHNDLKESVKFDIISRLVCKTFNAINATILIYDAKSDRLTTRGSYYSRKFFNSNSKSKNFYRVIMNAPLLEFFENSSMQNIGRLELKDFESYQLNIENEKFEMTQEEFELIKADWASSKMSKKYSQYKKLILSETHDIGGHTFTGEYFEELLRNKTQLTSDVKVNEISPLNKQSKRYFSMLEKLGIDTEGKSYIYVGAPLFATERYSGVLRIIMENTEELLRMNDYPVNRTKGLMLSEKYHERINSHAQIISLSLKTSFYLLCFRELSKLQIDLDEDLKINSNELDKVCDTVSDFLNCNGCLIRIKEDPKTHSTPIIRGISKSLNPYKEFVSTAKDSSFSQDIDRLFATVRHNRERVKAITFSIMNSNGDEFETSEFFYTRAGKLRGKAIPSRRFRDFTPDYKRVLTFHKMVEIAVVPLQHFEGSYIIFTNTKNRSFTLSDIEIMLLASQRIGLEIRHTQDSKRRTEEELDEGIQGYNRIIEHQVGQMVTSANNYIEQIFYRNVLANKRLFDRNEVDLFEVEVMYDKLKLLRFLIKQAKNQIFKRAGVEKIEKGEHSIQKVVISDFWKYLKNKCLDFEPYAYEERNLHVWLTNPEEKYLKITTDFDLLTEILNNLLDNAIKYSYEAREMKLKGVAFDELNYQSEGNILVAYKADMTRITITVTNWGYTINPNEHSEIIKKNIRGSNSHMVVGSGLGLYYVNQILNLLNGTMEIYSARNKTTFTITLSR